MATKSVYPHNPDNIDKLLYVKIVKRGQASYRGYKTVYLTQELSAMESDFLSCSMCQGISRNAILSEGEILCNLCKQGNSSSNPANKVRNSVANLNVKCPLSRDCGWNGKLVDGEKHLKECGKFFVTCTLKCGDVTERCEMSNHLKTECLLRKAKCEFCDLVIIFKNLNEHLMTCPAHPIVCKCSRVLRRDAVEEHIDKDCELTEIECPYAKYSCKIRKIPRKDLLAHKKEFYIEHQDMIERENCLLTKQVKTLKLHNSKLMRRHDSLEEKMKVENDQLMQKHELMEKTMKTKNDQLIRKHDLLEGKVKTNNDKSVLKHNTLEELTKANHSQLVQEYVLMSRALFHNIEIRKKLIGTEIDLDLRSRVMVSKEFGNGQYRFTCEILESIGGRNISLRRLPTATYSDKNIICITECMLCLGGITAEIPYYLNLPMFSRIETDATIPIVVLCNNIISIYQQYGSTLKMEVYFDCDYITYKGFFC